MHVLRGLTGWQLPCGCLVGSYELYDTTVVHLIDARAEPCSNPDHYDGAELPTSPQVAEVHARPVGGSRPAR